MKINWKSFGRGFVQSDYITAAWNWFVMLASKIAEPVLFGAVIYAGYEIMPGVPHTSPQTEALVTAVQNVALDIGGTGLIKAARRNGLGWKSFPCVVGIVLICLMVCNAIVFGVERMMPVPENVSIVIITIFLVIRMAMTVLYGQAIRLLKDDRKEEDKSQDIDAIIASVKGQLEAVYNPQIEQLKQRLEETQNSIIFAQIPAIEQPESPAPKPENTEQNEPAQTSPKTEEHNEVDIDLLQVLENYPNVANEWLAKNRKTVTIEEIIEVTGQSKRRVNRVLFQRSGRNKDLILVSSVIDWLKTAPLPTNKTEQNTDPLPVQKPTNGHRKITRELKDLIEFGV